jgi:C1A family cysteine protease
MGGWKPDLPDFRDYKVPDYLPSLISPSAVPSSLLVDDFQIPVFDQEYLGSCTANGTIFAYAQLAGLLGIPIPILSRLYNYYFTRVNYEHIDPNEDSGAQIRNAIKCIAQFGSCLERHWPYDPEPGIRFNVRPNRGAIKEAHQHMAIKYASVAATVTMVKQVMTQTKRPVVIGFSCYESLQSEQVSKTGIIPFPKADEAQIGGHCVAIRGFRTDQKLFRVRNSWGPSWGDHGDGYLPEQYLEAKLAADFWMLMTEMG